MVTQKTPRHPAPARRPADEYTHGIAQELPVTNILAYKNGQNPEAADKSDIPARSSSASNKEPPRVRPCRSPLWRPARPVSIDAANSAANLVVGQVRPATPRTPSAP